jgi:hypothetical protein
MPSLHLVRAALHVAAIIGNRRAETEDAAESYWHRATGGIFSPADLKRAELLLIDTGLLIAEENSLIASADLIELLAGAAEDAEAAIVYQCAVRMEEPASQSDAIDAATALISDPQRREELLLALGRRFDDALRRQVGEIGEELVVDAARAELEALGHPDLARAVRRVSLVSDQLGYDVSAPRVIGPARQLEVKATTAASSGDRISVFLSRNEADVGRRLQEWALVVCLIDDVAQRTGRIVGWCGASDLEPLLPQDVAGGRWETARVDLALSTLVSGLPSAAL